jgi:hypothetical protein
MPRIKTELLQPGMIVASDVKNIDNMLLIAAGCALTGRQISILQAWGVPGIEVQGPQSAEELDPLRKLSPEEVSRISAELKDRFWHPDESDPVHAEIFRLILQRRARRHLVA